VDKAYNPGLVKKTKMIRRQPSSTAARCTLLIAACILCLFPQTSAIEFDMVFQTKCVFKEVMDVDAMITARYEAFNKDTPANKVPLNVKVESPLGEVVFELKDSAASDFTIEHPMEGEYRLCFTSKSKFITENKTASNSHGCEHPITSPFYALTYSFEQTLYYSFLSHTTIQNFSSAGYQIAQNTRIFLKWREGVEATNFETLAKKDNLDSVHTELLRLEDSVHNIHLELQNIRRKEEQMRDVNGERNVLKS
jgi:emp24/gp25L/p24 family/GOLD